jgi:hypothetical protein
VFSEKGEVPGSLRLEPILLAQRPGTVQMFAGADQLGDLADVSQVVHRPKGAT